MLTGILFLVWLVCIAMLWNEGMWNNCITLINVLLAALLTMNYFEPLADFLDKQLPSFTFVVDYLSLWFVFFLSYAVLRGVTDSLSKHRVKFIMPVEQAGRIISVILIGWIMVCLTLTSLHTAPLARTAVRGGFQAEPMSNNFIGMAPDRMFLGYMQHRSKNALANNPLTPFDPDGEFVFLYGGRRQLFSEQEAVRVNKK